MMCSKRLYWNPGICISGSSRYLKSIVCEKVIKPADNRSTNEATTAQRNVQRNVTSIVSINVHKKLRYKIGLSHFAHAFVSDNINIYNLNYFI